MMDKKMVTNWKAKENDNEVELTTWFAMVS